jgi:PIN domain nuclease of toxin-antitoxin system
MILDSSAIMAAVLNEPGADKVNPYIGVAAMSAVNYAEAFTSLLSKGVDPVLADMTLNGFNLRIFNVTEAHAKTAALLWPITSKAGLSLGDRLCIALALELDDVVLTSDRAWATVPHGAKVTLIR